MLAHYLAVALAKFVKAPFTTAANVLTLALGLACFIAAYGIATYWRSGDAYHANAERTFIVGQNITSPGQEPTSGLNTFSTASLAQYLVEDFPELEQVARARPTRDLAVAVDERNATLQAGFVDPEFLRMFDLDFVTGDSRHALDEPGSIVLTQDAAARLFGEVPAMGRSVLVNGSWTAEVTGVIAPVRQPSFMGDDRGALLQFDMLGNWLTGPEGAQYDSFELWGALSGFTFFTLPPGVAADAINARFPDFLDARVPAEQQNVDIELRAFPVTDIAVQEMDNTLLARSGMNVSAVTVLLGLGALTLVVACVNYANLAAAQANTRAGEIGMRKVLGAGRAQVMVQSWLEAALLTVAGLALAFVFIALVAPAVSASTDVDILHVFSRGAAPYAVVVSVVAIAGFAAGAYPALVLSRVRPAQSLRAGRSRSGSRLIATLLVGIQFASASFLLILVTVTELQRAHLERVALASHDDPILVVRGFRPLGVDIETFQSRVSAVPGVMSVSTVNWQPWTPGFNTVRLARSLDPAANAPAGYLKSVGYGYFDTLDFDLLAGRVFDAEHDVAPQSIYAGDPSQTLSIVVDRAYAERLGFATPQSAVDEVVYLPEEFTNAWNRPAQAARIVGVTQNDPTHLEDTGMGGNVYLYSPQPLVGNWFPLVKISRSGLADAVAGIEEVWQDLAPNAPLNVAFFDQLFEARYQQYARVGQVFTVLASTAFIIASIGQLGVAVHVASRRRHEIGVRKVLGSTTHGVARLLLIDFTKPVLVANLLAWPLAYLAAQTYLAAFSERVPLTPAPFALSLAITLAIAWAAVIGEVLKASSVRPTEVLRHA
jgi:putative ABC transport system permease protein